MHEKIMKHGKMFGQLNVVYLGTDYFAFFHKPCCGTEAANSGLCHVEHLLLDFGGRIIFELRCLDCGFTDVLKTRFELWATRSEKHYERKILLEKKLVQAARLARASTKRSKTSSIGFDYLNCKKKEV